MNELPVSQVPSAYLHTGNNDTVLSTEMTLDDDPGPLREGVGANENVTFLCKARLHSAMEEALGTFRIGKLSS